MLKISIITVVLNNVDYIEDCIQSVIGQSYPNVEYIIVDGGSTDGTLDIIKKYQDNIAKFISEPDNGIYDAMNKGISLATGDVVGILNADDMYAEEHVVATVVSALEEGYESCYSDLVYVDRNNTDKTIRYWVAGEYNKERFRNGWMPPHPTFFVRREVYEKYGSFNLDFPLAADYELILRLLYKNGVSTAYINEVLVKMRTGGMSNPWLYTLKAIEENYRAWKVNDLRITPKTFFLKPFSKLNQFLKKPKA